MSRIHQPKGPPLCYLCQQRPGTTRDHIPPRNLITDTVGAQLITAPCCEQCRNQYRLDDEEFRNAVVLAADPRTTGPVYQAMLRSFQQRPPIKASVLRRIHRSGNRAVFWPRDDAMTRVCERIGRGLAYRKAKTLIPVNYRVDVMWNPIDVGPGLLAQAQVHGAIKEDFAYAGLIATENPAISIWWMSFYKSSGAIVAFDAPECEST